VIVLTVDILDIAVGAWGWSGPILPGMGLPVGSVFPRPVSCAGCRTDGDIVEIVPVHPSRWEADIGVVGVANLAAAGPVSRRRCHKTPAGNIRPSSTSGRAARSGLPVFVEVPCCRWGAHALPG